MFLQVERRRFDAWGTVPPSQTGFEPTEAEWRLLSVHASTSKPPRLGYQTTFYHLNTKLVCYLDAHCFTERNLNLVLTCDQLLMLDVKAQDQFLVSGIRIISLGTLSHMITQTVEIQILLNTEPFANWTGFNHSNTALVQYSDSHWYNRPVLYTSNDGAMLRKT